MRGRARIPKRLPAALRESVRVVRMVRGRPIALKARRGGGFEDEDASGRFGRRWASLVYFRGVFRRRSEGCELIGRFYQEAGPIEKIVPLASGIHIIPIIFIPAGSRRFHPNMLRVLPIPPIPTIPPIPKPAFAGQATESRKC